MQACHRLVIGVQEPERLRNAIIVFPSEAVLLLLGGCKQLSVSCRQNGWVDRYMW